MLWDHQKYCLTILQEDLVPSEQIYTFRVIHTFPLNRPKLICKESLFVADDRLESHYKRKDKRNRGKRKFLLLLN